jgi:hypothetical protein
MKIPVGKKKKSGIGMLVGAIVVAAVGVGGYLALASNLKPPAPPAAPPPAAVTPVETAPVAAPRQAPRRSPPRQVVTPPPPGPPAAPPPPPAAAQGFVSINSEPPGTVFIDGRDVGPVPVIDEPVSAGRHTIRVERAGYKTKSETMDVPANTTVRRRWVLDPEGSD